LRRFPEQNVVENIVFDIKVWKVPHEAIPVTRDYWLPLATSFNTGFPCMKKFDANILVTHRKEDKGGFVDVENLERLADSFNKDLNLPFSFNFSVASQLFGLPA